MWFFSGWSRITEPAEYSDRSVPPTHAVVPFRNSKYSRLAASSIDRTLAIVIDELCSLYVLLINWDFVRGLEFAILRDFYGSNCRLIVEPQNLPGLHFWKLNQPKKIASPFRSSPFVGMSPILRPFLKNSRLTASSRIEAILSNHFANALITQMVQRFTLNTKASKPPSGFVWELA